MEIYKDVIGYEGIYQVSNLGNVKRFKMGKEKIIKSSLHYKGYLIIGLVFNKVRKTIKVHQLVAESFLNHTRCGMELVVNHIDFNRINNNINNLEIISNRENSNKKHLQSSSIHTGVCWDKNRNKWKSQIYLNGKQKFLGRFNNELDASEAYQKELNKL